MEPRIQYAQTSDGVSIAHWTLGNGKPLVYLPSPPWTHIQLEWQDPKCRRWYECLAENRMLVRYDSRGSGLSERKVSDLSLDAHLRDLAAVVDRLRLERFALFAGGHGGPVATAYAAHHPERVSHLILWCTYARVADYSRLPGVHAARELLRSNWRYYTEQFAYAATGLSAASWHVGWPRSSGRPWNRTWPR